MQPRSGERHNLFSAAGLSAFVSKENHMSDKIEVSKVTAESGQTLYTRETDRARLLTLPGVKRIEDAWMTEDEFNAIPASPEAEAFFGGKQSAARAGE
jgi:hypothetical protein